MTAGTPKIDKDRIHTPTVHYKYSPLENVITDPVLNGENGFFHKLRQFADTKQFTPFAPVELDEIKARIDRGRQKLEKEARELTTSLATDFFGMGPGTYKISLVRRSHVVDGRSLLEDKAKLEKIQDVRVIDQFTLEETIDLTSMADQLRVLTDEALSFYEFPREEKLVGRLVLPQRTYYEYTVGHDKALHTDLTTIQLRFKSQKSIAQKVSDHIFGIDREIKKSQIIHGSDGKKSDNTKGFNYGVTDLAAIRGITGSVEGCYKFLRNLEMRATIDLISEATKDYIKNPKIKNKDDPDAKYQSIHAYVRTGGSEYDEYLDQLEKKRLLNNKHMIEIQIRDQLMHEIAEKYPSVSHDADYEREKILIREKISEDNPVYIHINDVLNSVMYGLMKPIRI